MERMIQKITPPARHKVSKMKRVAAYARVSSGREAPLHSLSAQISHYSGMIQKTPGWQYAGVYADEALSGTKDSRGEFQRLLADCKAGKIDMIITKSVSRFARNTVTTLKTIRELRLIGVDVFFEEQNIYTMGEDGEFLLTLLAAYAEEEARSVSSNIRWRVQSNFKQGLAWSVEMFGYHQKHGRLVIVPEQAQLLRMAAQLYLQGASPMDLERAFEKAGAIGTRGKRLSGDHIVKLLCNEKMAGDMLLQKTFVADPIVKDNRKNNGERPQFYVEGSHEGILDKDTYQKVLAEYRRRKAEGLRFYGEYPFSSRIICGKCGAHYTHRLRGKEVYAWVCMTYNTKGKSCCDAKIIQERVLESIAAEVTGQTSFDSEVFQQQVKEIQVRDNSFLDFLFYNGKIVSRPWENIDQRRCKPCQQ